MRLEVKAHGGAEDVVVCLHEPLLICVGLQVLRCVLDGLQAAVLRRLHVELGREVGTQRPVQAGMVTKITALRK